MEPSSSGFVMLVLVLMTVVNRRIALFVIFL